MSWKDLLSFLLWTYRFLYIVKNKNEPCFSNKELINDNGMEVCANCGQVNGVVFADEYIDFYENIYRIRKK